MFADAAGSDPSSSLQSGPAAIFTETGLQKAWIHGSPLLQGTHAASAGFMPLLIWGFSLSPSASPTQPCDPSITMSL